jgi:hypothetical protein
MIDLDKFCNPEREGLDRPFTIDDWTLAANGHIIVRVARRNDVGENPRAPTKDMVLAILGKGRVRFRPPTAWTREADGLSSDRVVIDGVWFAPHYIDLMIDSLPHLELGPARREKPLRFRFKDGVGALMPLATPSQQRLDAYARCRERFGADPTAWPLAEAKHEGLGDGDVERLLNAVIAKAANAARADFSARGGDASEDEMVAAAFASPAIQRLMSDPVANHFVLQRVIADAINEAMVSIHSEPNQ